MIADAAGIGDDLTSPSCGPASALTDVSAEAGLETLIAAIPEGWSRVRINGQTWAVSRRTRAGGKVISVETERLGSPESFGANVWLTERGAILKPCEIPSETVMRFLRLAAPGFTAS